MSSRLSRIRALINECDREGILVTRFAISLRCTALDRPVRSASCMIMLVSRPRLDALRCWLS